MNRYRKGKQIEKLACERLMSEGYEILFKSVFVRFQQIDFGGLFDIVAVRDKHWHFVQVKSRKDNKQFKEIEKFAKEKAPLYSTCEMWVWNRKKRDFDRYII